VHYVKLYIWWACVHLASRPRLLTYLLTYLPTHLLDYLLNYILMFT